MSDAESSGPARRPLAALHLLAVAVGLVGMSIVLAWTMGNALRGTTPSGDSTGSGPSTDTVVMFVLEEVGPETLEKFALNSNLMPNLSALARESTWFHRHWAQCNATNAAFATLLTGRYASRLGLGELTRRGRESLSGEARLLSEDFDQAGFRCFGSLGSTLMST